MSSSPKILLSALLHTVLEKEQTSALFQKMYSEGGNFEQVLQLVHSQMLPELKKEMDSLSQAKEQDLEKFFFSSKNTIHEACEWLKLARSVSIEQTKILSITEEQGFQTALALLKESEEKINSYAEELLSYRETKLQKDYTDAIDAILREMHTLLFSHMEMKKRIPLLHYHLSKQVFKRVQARLSEAQAFILKYRSRWEKEVIESARALYIYTPSEFAFPLLYTKEGKIYLLQEIVEHFVGAGASKYVSHTFEMQEGKVRALIRPKKKYPDNLSEAEKNFMKKYNFAHALKETMLLKILKGKRGIIEQYEAHVFECNEDTNLFQICELFDSTDLELILQKAHREPKLIHLSPHEKLAIARDMLYGIASIHQAGIIHHDIKPGNVLVHIEAQEKKTRARIIDFNSSVFDHDTAHKTDPSVAAYAPPEFCKVMYENEALYGLHFAPVTTFAMDIWGMGCIFYELFFEQPLPWSQCGKNSERFNAGPVIGHTIEVSLLQDEWIPKQYHSHPLYPLLSAMLQVDPLKRISSQEALSLFEKLAPSFS